MYAKIDNDALVLLDFYEEGCLECDNIKPEYDENTQWCVGPRVQVVDGVLTCSYQVVDKTTEELNAELDIIKTAQKQVIKKAWLDDIANVGMPVNGESFSVDYDIKDALIWGNAIDYIPETATTVEVRAIDNTSHTIAKTLFVQIPSLQKAYYATQLQKKWALQESIDNATTAEELEAISWK